MTAKIDSTMGEKRRVLSRAEKGSKHLRTGIIVIVFATILTLLFNTVIDSTLITFFAVADAVVRVVTYPLGAGLISAGLVLRALGQE